MAVLAVVVPASKTAANEGNLANGSLGVGAVNTFLGTINVLLPANNASSSAEMEEENDEEFAPGDHIVPSLFPNVRVGSLSSLGGGMRARGNVIARPGRGENNKSDACEPVTDSGNPPSEEALPELGNPNPMPLDWLGDASSTSIETDCQKALLRRMLSPLDSSLSASMSSSVGLTVVESVAAIASLVSCTGVKYGLIFVAVKSKWGGASRREEVSWNAILWGFSLVFSPVVRGTVRTPSAVRLRFLLWRDGAEEARLRVLTASSASMGLAPRSKSATGLTGVEGYGDKG